VNVVVFKFLKHYFTENNHYHNLHDDVHLFYTIYISFKFTITNISHLSCNSVCVLCVRLFYQLVCYPHLLCPGNWHTW